MKHKTLAAIAEKYELKVEDVQPIKYDGEDEGIVLIRPRSWSPSVIGKKHGGVGYEKGVNAVSGEL